MKTVILYAIASLFLCGCGKSKPEAALEERHVDIATLEKPSTSLVAYNPYLEGSSYDRQDTLIIDVPAPSPCYYYAPEVYEEPIYQEVTCIPCDPWPGLYLGFHGGYAFAAPSISLSPLPSVDEAGFLSENVRPQVRGGFGGGQIGFNCRYCRFIWGLEADASFGNIKGSKETSPLFTTADVAIAGTSFRANERIEFFGTVRPRLGWSWNSSFLYLTGGFAWGRISVEANTRNDLTGEESFTSFRKAKSGWTVGAGLEYALFCNWSIKAEYLYLNFGTLRGVGGNTTFIAPFEAGYTFRSHLHTVRFGLNFIFK